MRLDLDNERIAMPVHELSPLPPPNLEAWKQFITFTHLDTKANHEKVRLSGISFWKPDKTQNIKFAFGIILVIMLLGF